MWQIVAPHPILYLIGTPVRCGNLPHSKIHNLSLEYRRREYCRGTSLRLPMRTLD